MAVVHKLCNTFGSISVLIHYMTALLNESVGLEDRMFLLIAELATIPYLDACGPAASLVENFGRRIMMLVITALQLFCFFMLTLFICFVQKPGREYSP